jgi:hypothetical protein
VPKTVQFSRLAAELAFRALIEEQLNGGRHQATCFLQNGAQISATGSTPAEAQSALAVLLDQELGGQTQDADFYTGFDLERTWEDGFTSCLRAMRSFTPNLPDNWKNRVRDLNGKPDPQEI